ncbi:MAG: YhjD/YihY/BrkB family envelope integrity protein [Gammaproteobacteria bacterium]
MNLKTIESSLFARHDHEQRPVHWLRTYGQIAWLLVRDIFEGRLNLYAMSLVYSTLIAIVPLLAFAVAALKGLGIKGVLGPSLNRLLEPLGSAGHELSDKILLFVGNVNVSVLGIFGILLLAFTAISLLRKIESGLNAAWQVNESRPALSRSMQYISLLIVGPVFLFAAFGVTATLTNRSVMQHLSIIGAVLPALGKLLPYLIAITAFTLINLITPNTRVKFRAALAAGIAGGIVWQGAGQIFALLTAQSTRLSAVYSSFAILILFLSWLYLSWLILLLGARIGFYVQNPAWRRPHDDRQPLAPASAEATALDIMLAATERFADGKAPLTMGTCVGRTGISGLRLEPVFDHLVAADLLFRVGGRGYALARSAEKITVAEVLNAARGEVSVAKTGLMDDLLGKAHTARIEALGQTTLADLAQDKTPNTDTPETEHPQ